MKKIFILTLILSLTIFGCKKGADTSTKATDETDDVAAIENVTQYAEHAVWAYENEADLEKKPGNVKNKEWFDFGSKFTVIKSKKINGKEYSQIQLPDDTIYWLPSDALATKFIIINRTDVSTFTQPDLDYTARIKLQPGDFGILQKEKDGFINVDFKAYRPYSINDDTRKWVGNLWIKDGYTDDLKAAKEAYNLYLAYYWKIGEDNTERALKALNEALEVNAGEETEISYVVKDYIKELEGTSLPTVSE